MARPPNRHFANPVRRRWTRTRPCRVPQDPGLTAGLSHPGRRNCRFRTGLEVAQVFDRLHGRFLAPDRRARAAGCRTGGRGAGSSGIACRVGTGVWQNRRDARVEVTEVVPPDPPPRRLPSSAGFGVSPALHRPPRHRSPRKRGFRGPGRPAPVGSPAPASSARGSMCSRSLGPARPGSWSSPAGRPQRIRDHPRGVGLQCLADRADSPVRVAHFVRANGRACGSPTRAPSGQDRGTRGCLPGCRNRDRTIGLISW